MIYVGIDLTDPFAKRPRPVTRAIMDESQKVSFSQWEYEITGAGMVAEEENAVVAIDGPQGLAMAGAKLRECERLLRAAGKTPDVLPEGKPFAGFIRGSVDLFRELVHRIPLVQNAGDNSARLLEVYPGAAWLVMTARKLPKKTTKEGRQLRKLILEAHGMSFPLGLPTHDELDAALAAYIAWCFSKGEAVCVGARPFYDGSSLREGYIVQPPSLATL